MQTDLTVIKKEAQNKFEENQTFFIYLKKFASEILSPHIKEISNKVSSKVDCTACANCCKSLNPTLVERNIIEFSETLKEDQMLRLKENLFFDKMNNRWIVNSSPCPLLENNLCVVYSGRPHSCREYPHIEPNEFKYKKISIINNYGICPIVYNTVELLKERLKFNSLQEN